MTWLKPKDEHIIYEALSAIADERLELLDETHARCTSTSKGKFYSITFDPDTKSIMSDDNMAYYRDELSYPMVAMLIARGDIIFDQNILTHFKGIKWKDINQRNKNNYMKSVAVVLAKLANNGVDIVAIEREVAQIFQFISALDLAKLGEKVIPPQAY